MAGKELELQLMDGGNKLLNPPFSIDELLSILERVEVSLSKVDQSPRQSMVAALSPLRNALVSDKLLRHSDTDVKEIFHLIVAVFHKLSHTSSCCYSKVVLVLVTMAKTRAILVMMDLECHALIIEMFQLFLRITRSNNSEVVLDAMVTTMTIAILESDDISLEILVPLLASVRKENQNVFPKSWKLGKEVIKNCAARIEPYILKAVSSLGVPVDSYDQIVGSICQNATDCIKSFDVPGSEEHLVSMFIIVFNLYFSSEGKEAKKKRTSASAWMLWESMTSLVLQTFSLILNLYAAHSMSCWKVD
ncbi:hypothetical protein GH714_000006 [Hevea brasiliensis]|uniref:Uncharacterized protein n=1 Tax=Hevea brasiliensis TaxID=3981 RepID=A0A6A6NA68_HEVBR|nr:hypothetical protein GH714_000006 [Hevea brasiliensis]